MCFTLIGMGDKSINRGVALSTWVSETGTNKDGYALRSLDTNQYIRTLKENKIVSEILKVNAKTIQLHYRNSTNKICEEYVHLWKIKNFTLGHNGVLTGLKHENDSLGFAELAKDAIANKDIRKVKDIIEDIGGYGVFTILYDDGEAMLISKGKSLKITKLNESNIFFSSDKIKLYKNVTLVEDNVIKEFHGFRFKYDKKIEVNTNLENSVSYRIEKSDVIYLIDKNGTKRDSVNIKKPNLGIYGNSQIGYYSRGKYNEQRFNFEPDMNPALWNK